MSNSKWKSWSLVKVSFYALKWHFLFYGILKVKGQKGRKGAEVRPMTLIFLANMPKSIISKVRKNEKGNSSTFWVVKICLFVSYIHKLPIQFWISDTMPNSCSVIGCDNDKHVFHVKESWKVLNDLGWKDNKHLFICEKHFRVCDICGNNKKKFLRPTATPMFFLHKR